jgi:hypothetical protein
MVQLLFARLPQFKDDAIPISSTKRVKDLSTRGLTTNNQSRSNEQQTNGRMIFLVFGFLFIFI